MAGKLQKPRTGTPDMKPVIVGGPSAHGQARAGAHDFILQLIRQAIVYFGGRRETARAQRDLRALADRVKKEQAKHPRKGFLIALQYIVQQASPEATGSGNAYRYTGYLYGWGGTISEARQHQMRKVIRPGLRSNEKFAYQVFWYPPKATPKIARPFPVIGRGSFIKGRVRLQEVSWSTMMGFNDGSQISLPGPGSGYCFEILKAPTSIVTSHGSTGPVKVPVVLRPVGQGRGTLPVVDLDSSNPFGNVTAAMVFPADQVTASIFAKKSATRQNPPGTIRGLVNFDRVRWVRPENIRLLSKKK